MQYRKLIKNYGTITFTANNQPQQQVPLPNYGDLKGLDFQVTVATTIGSGTSRKISSMYFLHGIALRDKNQQPIINAGEGYDIPFETFMLSKKLGRASAKGRYPTIANAGDTGGTAMVYVPCRVASADQPAVLDLTIGNTGDVLSTVGSASSTITVAVYGIWEDAALTTQGQAALPTMRIEAIPKIMVTGAGDNTVDMMSQLSREIIDTGVLSVGTYAVGADADFTAFTLAPNGGAGLDAIDSQNVIDEENLDTYSGHQTGFYSLGHQPYVVTTLTKFIVTGLISKVLRLYLMRDSV